MAINFILSTYIFKQLITLFLFTVSLLSAVGVAIGTLSELAYQIDNYNLPLIVALKIFVYKIPEYVTYGLPIATLLTTLIVYGRLSRESEIIAFKSVGINTIRIILPGIYLSILVTVITFIGNEMLVPQANYQANNLKSVYLPETDISLQQKDIFYPEYELKKGQEKQLKMLYYAKNFDGRQFINVVIIRWQNNKIKQIVTANKAYWNPSLQLWKMNRVTVYNLGNIIDNTSKQSFSNYQIALPITLFTIAKQNRDPYAMSLSEARNYLNLITNSGNLKTIRLLEVRIQQKLAFPFICIIFALIGSAIGTTYNNLNRGKSFGACVAIAFGYYLFGFMIGSLGIAGLIHPIIAAWLPNAIGLGCGLWLLR